MVYFDSNLLPYPNLQIQEQALVTLEEALININLKDKRCCTMTFTGVSSALRGASCCSKETEVASCVLSVC